MSKMSDKIRQLWANFSGRQKIVLLVFGLIVSFVVVTAILQGVGKLIKGNEPEPVELNITAPAEIIEEGIPTFRIPEHATDEEVDSLLMEFYNNI